MRNTFTPASSKRSSISGESHAGPSVATILVFAIETGYPNHFATHADSSGNHSCSNPGDHGVPANQQHCSSRACAVATGLEGLRSHVRYCPSPWNPRGGADIFLSRLAAGDRAGLRALLRIRHAIETESDAAL